MQPVSKDKMTRGRKGSEATYGIDEIELPAVSFEKVKGHRVGVNVERQSRLNRVVHNHKTLGPQLVR